MARAKKNIFEDFMLINQEEKNRISLIPKGDFSVEKTFDCGQCFRFDKVENSPHECEFRGVAFGRAVSFANDGKRLYIYGADANDFENIWCHFLGLDRDYDAINADILSRSDNPALKNAVEFGRGIRILSQDPWESVCSFIISQNNNIPRIKKIVASLSEKYGRKIGENDHAFPTPEAVNDAGEEGMFALKTGFRAKYLADAARRVCDGRLDLEEIAELESTVGADKKLCEVKGIGPKVASCALLFGFERYDAFPIDVWMKRIIKEEYTDKGRELKIPDKYAGILQQFMFYTKRLESGK